MILITKQDKIKNIVKSWTRQYGDSHQDTLIKLKETQPTTEDQITGIIGNASWTSNSCDECCKDCDVTVLIGQELDYESATANICPDCLQKALDKIKEP